MKVFFFLSLFLGLAVALEFSEPEGSYGMARKQRRSTRPQKASDADAFVAVKTPVDAPAEYYVGTAHMTENRPTTELQELPAGLVKAGLRRRQESLHTLRQLQRELAKADFYECRNSNPAPVDADCQAVVNQVANTKQTLVVQQRACVTFNYQTCQGFFCALCDTLATTTDFISNQLDSAEFLCVADGKSGSVVGENPPQWDAGFVRAGSSIPTYGVC